MTSNTLPPERVRGVEWLPAITIAGMPAACSRAEPVERLGQRAGRRARAVEEVARVHHRVDPGRDRVVDRVMPGAVDVGLALVDLALGVEPAGELAEPEVGVGEVQEAHRTHESRRRTGRHGPQRRRGAPADGRPVEELRLPDQRRLSVTLVVSVVAGLPQSRICTETVIFTLAGPPLRASSSAIADDGLNVTVAVCGPQQRTSVVSIVELLSFSRLRIALETVSFAEPSIAPVHATGTFRPRRASVARQMRDVIVPRRNEAGVSIIAGSGADRRQRPRPAVVAVVAAVAVVDRRSLDRPDLEVERLVGLVAGGVHGADLDRVRTAAGDLERTRAVRGLRRARRQILDAHVAVLHRVRAAVVLEADVALGELPQRGAGIARAVGVLARGVVELVQDLAVAADRVVLADDLDLVVLPRPALGRVDARLLERGCCRTCRSSRSCASHRSRRRRAGSRDRS